MSRIEVTSKTQRMVLNPSTSAVTIVNAGPIGPKGPAGNDSGSGLVTETEFEDSINTLREEFMLVSPKSQIIAATAGENVIDLNEGSNIHISHTEGTWTPTFVNVPASGVSVYMSINVTADGHEPTFTNVSWYGTTPLTADWDASETNVIRLTKLPFVEKWIAEWIYNAATPGDAAIVPPVLSAFYASEATLLNPQTLSGSTLPAGEVAVFFSLLIEDRPKVASMRLFVNHVGAIPTVGAEGDSYVGTRTADPYSLMGNVLDGSGQFESAIMWDTNFDPTGNNRVDYNKNGVTTLTAEALLIDGQTVETTITFNTSNAPVGSTPTYSHTAAGYAGADSSHSIDIPAGVDRAVLVVASYKVANNTRILNGMTIGGNAMSQVVAASKAPAADGIAQFVAYATEAQLATGIMVLDPSWASSPTAYSNIIYDVWIFTNVSTPVFDGAWDYANVAETINHVLDPSVVSVPANSFLVTVGAQQFISNPEATLDLGTPTATVEIATEPTIEARSFTVEDSGASATKTATWSMEGRAIATLVYMDYVASAGGDGEETPIIPAVPVIGTIVVADNQLTVPWGPATDAESYEIRWSTSNPPATSPVVAVSPRVITGLAASVQIHTQVRSRSSTGHFSAWSAVSSATPTGSVTPTETWRDRYPVSFDHRDVMYTEGGGTWDYPDLWAQRGFRRVNPVSTEYGLHSIVSQSSMQNAMGSYESRGSRARAFRTACGPRLIITGKQNITTKRHTQGTTATDIAAKAQSVLDQAKSGSTGAINRDDTWRTLAANINKEYTSSSGQKYMGYDVVFYSVAHENNGAWSTAYAGTNTQMIGRPEFTASGGATATNYGSEMAAALIRVGQTGSLDHVHRLACEHIMEILWSIQPKIIIGMTPAAGNGSQPTGSGSFSLSPTWIESSFPRKSLGYGIDFLCPTLYNRGNPKDYEYDGSGDVDDWTNFITTRSSGWLEDEQELNNRLYGCPFGLLEFGGAYAMAGEATPGQGGTTYDDVQAAFMERILEHELINAPGKSENGLAFVCHWNFLEWNSGHSPDTTPSSFNIIEGSWGRFPDGVYPSSTGKPAHSTRSAPMYPKSLAYLKSQYG